MTKLTIPAQDVLLLMSNPEVCKAACRVGEPTDPDNITILLLERDGEFAVMEVRMIRQTNEQSVKDTIVGKGRVGLNRAISEFSRLMKERSSGARMVQLSVEDAKLRGTIMAAIA